MPSWMALVKGPNGLIKRERSACSGDRIIALIKVENVSQERISVINLNHYRIIIIRHLVIITLGFY